MRTLLLSCMSWGALFTCSPLTLGAEFPYEAIVLTDGVLLIDKVSGRNWILETGERHPPGTPRQWNPLPLPGVQTPMQQGVHVGDAPRPDSSLGRNYLPPGPHSGMPSAGMMQPGMMHGWPMPGASPGMHPPGMQPPVIHHWRAPAIGLVPPGSYLQAVPPTAPQTQPQTQPGSGPSILPPAPPIEAPLPEMRLQEQQELRRDRPYEAPESASDLSVRPPVVTDENASPWSDAPSDENKSDSSKKAKAKKAKPDDDDRRKPAAAPSKKPSGKRDGKDKD